MKQRMQKCTVVIGLLSCMQVLATSMVYNFRIAQVTKPPVAEQRGHNKTVVALLFEQYFKKYNGIDQNFTGALGSFIYNINDYYFRTDIAIAQVTDQLSGVVNFVGREFDDILFTFGRTFKMDQKNGVALSGLFGVPTHKIVNLQHAAFGFSQVSLGVQLDGSHAFNWQQAFVYGGRYIRFFQRTAKDFLGQKYKFTLNNMLDFLFAYQHRNVDHGFQVGYTARLIFDVAIKPYPDTVVPVLPNIEAIINSTVYITNNFYLVYLYKFMMNNKQHRLLANIAYGFDSRPKIIGNKHIVTFWVAWSLSF